jgi:hypothetical protein
MRVDDISATTGYGDARADLLLASATARRSSA